MKLIHKASMVVLGVVVIAAALTVSRLRGEPEKTEPAMVEQAVKVVSGTVQEGQIPRFLLLTGELRAEKESLVAADAMGKVASAPIERGFGVEKGDVLVRLDERAATLSVREAEAALALARARFELSKNDFERNESLSKSHAISEAEMQRFKSDFQSRSADLQSAQVRLDTAQKNLSDMSIRAPYAGTIAERLVQVGEYVHADSGVARLVDDSALRLALNVPESLAGNIQAGQEVTFTVSTFPKETFTGKVKFIGASIRASSRDLMVEAEVANPNHRLRPGMFASARLLCDQSSGITIPEAALLHDSGRNKVFVIQKNRLVEKLVDTGETFDSRVEIRHGLAKGELVVLNPDASLRDGVPAQL